MTLINKGLISNPLNWVVVGVMATVWLLAFHSIMQAFDAIQDSNS